MNIQMMDQICAVLDNIGVIDITTNLLQVDLATIRTEYCGLGLVFAFHVAGDMSQDGCMRRELDPVGEICAAIESRAIRVCAVVPDAIKTKMSTDMFEKIFGGWEVSDVRQIPVTAFSGADEVRLDSSSGCRGGRTICNMCSKMIMPALVTHCVEIEATTSNWTQSLRMTIQMILKLSRR